MLSGAADAEKEGADSLASTSPNADPTPEALSAPIEILSPSDSVTDDRVVTVNGTVDDMSSGTVTLNTNGRLSMANISNGSFSGVVSLTVGPNKIVATAGGSSSTPVIVNCTDDPSQIWAELVWDGPGDVDLHVRQPNGQDVAYDNKNPVGGGHLDVDNTVAFGPEHYFISAARGDSIYRGRYQIYLVYYSSKGPVNCTVTVLKNEKPFGTYRLHLDRTGQIGNIVAVPLP